MNNRRFCRFRFGDEIRMSRETEGNLNEMRMRDITWFNRFLTPVLVAILCFLLVVLYHMIFPL